MVKPVEYDGSVPMSQASATRPLAWLPRQQAVVQRMLVPLSLCSWLCIRPKRFIDHAAVCALSLLT